MGKRGFILALLTLLMAWPRALLAGTGLNRAFIIGFWIDDDGCGNLIEFTPDGRFLAADGGTGLWTLDGDRLTMTGRDTAILRIDRIDRDTITVVNEDGSLGRSIRCAARRVRDGRPFPRAAGLWPPSKRAAATAGGS